MPILELLAFLCISKKALFVSIMKVLTHLNRPAARHGQDPLDSLAARVSCNLPLNSAPPGLLTLEELKLTYLDSPTVHATLETPTDIKFSKIEK